MRTHIATFEAGESRAWMFLPAIRGGVLKATDSGEGIKECQVAGRAIGRAWQGEMEIYRCVIREAFLIVVYVMYVYETEDTRPTQ